MINRAVFMHRPFCFEYCAEPTEGGDEDAARGGGRRLAIWRLAGKE